MSFSSIRQCRFLSYSQCKTADFDIVERTRLKNLEIMLWAFRVMLIIDLELYIQRLLLISLLHDSSIIQLENLSSFVSRTWTKNSFFSHFLKCHSRHIILGTLCVCVCYAIFLLENNDDEHNFITNKRCGVYEWEGKNLIKMFRV